MFIIHKNQTDGLPSELVAEEYYIGYILSCFYNKVISESLYL